MSRARRSKLHQAWRTFHWKVRRKVATFLVEAIYGEDLMWDCDNLKDPIYSLEEWAHDEIGCSVGERTQITVQRAFSLPKRTYRIEPYAPDPTTDDTEYKVTRIPDPKRKRTQ